MKDLIDLMNKAQNTRGLDVFHYITTADNYLKVCELAGWSPDPDYRRKDRIVHGNHVFVMSRVIS